MSKILASLVACLCVVSLAGLIAGCGGGGGGANSGGNTGVGVLGVTANFTAGTASGPTGVSEVISIKTASGTVLQKQTLNKPSTGGITPLISFGGLPNQTLYFHAVLYSGTNGTGSATGTIDTTFPGGTASTISTAIGQAISSVIVTPSDPSVAAGAGLQLLAAAQDANLEFVFESSQAKWSSAASGVASVNASGLLTAVAAGQTTISATLNSVLGSTSLVVTGITKGTWTILVYMNADNNLDADSIENESQMEQIAQTATSQTRIIIQWKLSNTAQSQSTDVDAHPFPTGSMPDDTRRYVEVQGGKELVQDLGQGIDMGSSTTLQNFVSWGVQNYPAQHYALVLWDHGNGWSFKTTRPKVAAWRGISYDSDTGNHIDVNEIAPAISPNHLDILAFDACQMQMLEIENQVAGVANYMVGSEDNTPDPGYPYNTVFSQFFANPNNSVPTLAESIVTAYINDYNESPGYGSLPLSESVVDLSKIPAVTSALNTFSEALLTDAQIGATSQAVRADLINYASSDGFYYFDLGSIAKQYSQSSAPSAVTNAASSLASAEAAAVLVSKTDLGGSPPKSLSPNSTGISIDFSPSNAFAGYASDYIQLSISHTTHWEEFLGSSTANP